ncbi:MAG TPA: IS630 family transposase, partial [Ruminococcaceae bacterium]|nr:IS630 family transposase [Oscillospiraceae bacterium]
YRHHIREYKYAYGAVDPVNGDKFFLVLPNCDTACMNVFLRELSAVFPRDYLLIATDNAIWHKAKALVIPENIRFFYIPPRTPELNPIEQIWK